MELGLEATVIGVALGEAVTDEDHAFAGGGRGDLLGTLGRGGRRILGRSVRRRRTLAVVRPVGRVGLGFLGLEFAVIRDRLVGGDQAGGEEGKEEAGAGLPERGVLAYL